MLPKRKPIYLPIVTSNFSTDDLRRSKQQNSIAAQNALYNLDSSSASFNQQRQQQQPQKSNEITSLKPSIQYQSTKVTTVPTINVVTASTSPPRYSQISRKNPATQVTKNAAAQPAPFILPPSPPSSSLSNSNSMFFKHTYHILGQIYHHHLSIFIDIN